MKKQILTFFILFISSLISFPLYAENFTSSENAVEKLEAYTVKDIEDDKERLKKRRELKIDEMFKDLERAMKYLEKSPLTEELAFQLERVSLITLIHDPSAYAIEIILPVYQKNKDLFKKAAKKLHPVDRDLILDLLQSHDEADREGQG